jgi:hypothetical protein
MLPDGTAALQLRGIDHIDIDVPEKTEKSVRVSPNIRLTFNVEPCMMDIWLLVGIRKARKTHGFGISRDGNFSVCFGIINILDYVHAIFNLGPTIFM